MKPKDANTEKTKTEKVQDAQEKGSTAEKKRDRRYCVRMYIPEEHKEKVQKFGRGLIGTKRVPEKIGDYFLSHVVKTIEEILSDEKATEMASHLRAMEDAKRAIEKARKLRSEASTDFEKIFGDRMKIIDDQGTKEEETSRDFSAK